MKHHGSWLFGGLISAALLLSADAEAQPFVLFSLQNANVIDNDASPTDGLVYQKVFTSSSGQRWLFSNNLGCIKTLSNGKFLGAANEKRDAILQSSPTGNANQGWMIGWIKKANGVDQFELRNASNQLCLTLGNKAPWPPFPLIQKSCSKAHDQLWSILNLQTNRFAVPQCSL